MTATFFDSSIVVYAVDPRDESAEKRTKSRKLVENRRLNLSTQVLMESFSTLIETNFMPRDLAQAYIGRLSAYPIVSIEKDDVSCAMDLSEEFQISHWDGMLLRSAHKARTPILYTEDLNHGQTYGSVRVCNPYIQDFLA